MIAKGPGTATATDGPLIDLKAYLRQVIGNQVRDLEVHVCLTGIRLTGKARSFYVKQLAQETILKLTPHPLVANEIEAS